MTKVPTYSLSELAKLADVTPRTVRFYIAQGLLPSPDHQGPSTRYTDDHLARLLAIKKLQAAHLPLAEIRQQLRAVPAHEFAMAADAPAPGSAIDYVRDVLARRPAQAYSKAPPMPALPSPSTPPPAAAPQTQSGSARSQWERVALDPDIELHVRRPLTRHQNKRVERLISIARELFEED